VSEGGFCRRVGRGKDGSIAAAVTTARSHLFPYRSFSQEEAE